MSISINSIGQNLAMDGLTNHFYKGAKRPEATSGQSVPENVNAEVANVAKNLAENMSKVKEQISQQILEVQKISNMIGRKLQFNVNEKLNQVIVSIVDPETNQVIKEIPSEELQQMRIRIRENISFLIDEKA